MKNKYLIYCYLDNAIGRDTEIVLPVCYALETYFDCEVKFLFIWDIYKIRQKAPDLVLLPNCRGHHMYVEIASYAKQNAIKVLALESEGNFKTDGSFDFWGYNHDKEIYQEWLCCWSDRTKTYIQEKVVNKKEKQKVVLTGGTGFDKYAIQQFTDRDHLLKKYNKQHFKKVIGYAGWAFGKLYGAHKHLTFLKLYPNDPEKRYKWVEEHRKFVRDLLKEAIEANPDILFILKRHPKESFESDINEGLNEMNELVHYPNVLYIRKEEDVHNLIAVSDIWLGFKTTTALEAWLLNKPTILINEGHPHGIDNLYNGSLKVTDLKQLQAFIDEHYNTSTIKAFKSEQLIQIRKTIIEDAIGFGDGLNHLRATYYFTKSLKIRQYRIKPAFNLRHLRLYLLMNVGRFFFVKSLFQKLPFFKKTIYVFENRGLPNFKKYQDVYYNALTSFYKKRGLDKILKKGEWPF